MDNKAVLKRFAGNRDEHVILDLKRKILYIDNSIVQEIIYENWTGSKLIEYFTCITQGNLNNVKRIKKINAGLFEMIVINRINKLFKMAKQYYRLRQDPKKAILSHYMKKIVTNFIIFTVLIVLSFAGIKLRNNFMSIAFEVLAIIVFVKQCLVCRDYIRIDSGKYTATVKEPDDLMKK